jgi:hypothetical protein
MPGNRPFNKSWAMLEIDALTVSEQTALYTFSWFSARPRQFGRDKDVTDKNGIDLIMVRADTYGFA